MDTAQVAEFLKTSPRLLRQFLRSPSSTFVSVGSGARYDFTDSEVETIAKRFPEWRANGKARSVTTSKTLKAPRTTTGEDRRQKDKQVWQEEGPVTLEDIRDPRVRARVRRDAQDAEDRLQMALMAVGLHITQPEFSSRKAS
jgi:hypothetical protein